MAKDRVGMHCKRSGKWAEHDPGAPQVTVEVGKPYHVSPELAATMVAAEAASIIEATPEPEEKPEVEENDQVEEKPEPEKPKVTKAPKKTKKPRKKRATKKG